MHHKPAFQKTNISLCWAQLAPAWLSAFNLVRLMGVMEAYFSPKPVFQKECVLHYTPSQLFEKHALHGIPGQLFQKAYGILSPLFKEPLF